MVIHPYYAIGQIDYIERKQMNGVGGEYFKVKTKNEAYWFPIDSLENHLIRPMASQEIILSVIEIL